jgi:hypothetical protein
MMMMLMMVMLDGDDGGGRACKLAIASVVFYRKPTLHLPQNPLFLGSRKLLQLHLLSPRYLSSPLVVSVFFFCLFFLFFSCTHVCLFELCFFLGHVVNLAYSPLYVCTYIWVDPGYVLHWKSGIFSMRPFVSNPVGNLHNVPADSFSIRSRNEAKEDFVFCRAA